MKVLAPRADERPPADDRDAKSLGALSSRSKFVYLFDNV
jgi:hypothetical protein